MPRRKGGQQNGETCRQLAGEDVMGADELAVGIRSSGLHSGNLEDELLDLEAAIFSDSEENKTCKQRLIRLLDGPSAQITIVLVSWLLSHVLLLELLVDTRVLHFEHDRLIARVIHWAGLGVLSVFAVEVLARLACHQWQFFDHKIEVLDFALVLIAYVPMIVVSIELAPSTAWDGFSLIIILRIWRCLRVVQGYVSPVREEGCRKVHVLLQAQRRAHQELQTLYLMQDENQEEIHRLRCLLGRRREADSDSESLQLQMALERRDSKYVAQLISTIEQRQGRGSRTRRDRSSGRDSPLSTIVVHTHRSSDSDDVPSGTITSRLSQSTAGDSGISEENKQQQADVESRNHTNRSCSQLPDCRQTLAVVEPRGSTQYNRSPGCSSKRNPAVSVCNMDHIDVIGSEVILQERKDSTGKKFLNGKLPLNRDSKVLLKDVKLNPSDDKLLHNKSKVSEKGDKAEVKDTGVVPQDSKAISRNCPASQQDRRKVRKGHKKSGIIDTYDNAALLLEMTELQRKGDTGYSNDIVLEKFYQNGNAPATAL